MQRFAYLNPSPRLPPETMQLTAILPEVVLAALCLVLTPVSVMLKGRYSAAIGIAASAGVLAALYLIARMLYLPPASAFEGAWSTDGLALVFKLLILLGAFFTLLLMLSYFRTTPLQARAPIGVLYATLGGMGLASANDFALALLFFPLLMLACCLLASLVRGEARTLEASLKLYILSAVALAVTAYALTFFYGLTGSTALPDLGAAAANADTVWLAFAFVASLAATGFLAAVLPFHAWAPDVFSGATAPVSAFLSVVPRIAALAFLVRLALVSLPAAAAGWPWLLAALAVFTMTAGNLVALRQREMKRMLAWSSIAQGGYLLAGVSVAEWAGTAVPAVAYYLAAYLFMNMGAFAVTAQVERAFASDRFRAFRGLGYRAPVAATVLSLSVLSLAGLPPLAGFAGKVFILEALMRGGMTWLAVIATLNFILALYYYFLVVVEVFFRHPEYGHPVPAGLGTRTAYVISLAGTLILGILPGPFLQFAARALEIVR